MGALSSRHHHPSAHEADGGHPPYPFCLRASVDANVLSIMVQADGKIVIAGSFTTVNGETHNHIARLLNDAAGSLDIAFSTNADNNISMVVTQFEGKILLGGIF